MERRKALRNIGLMGGAVLTMPMALSLLQSCQSVTRTDWQPQFLNNEEADFISILLDTILPRTATPGALDVKADLFIDQVFAEVYDTQGQQNVRKEIAQFNADCKEKHGDVFANLDNAGRIAVLTEAEATSPKFNGSVWGTAVGNQAPVGFYRSMKSMALWAYFSSEEVGQDILRFDPVPGQYDGCLALGADEVKWSLG